MAPAPDELASGDLIRVALDLLDAAERRRSSAHLRRALSTAYYAMFHSLARVSADRLIGRSTAFPDHAAWLHVYRALQHRHAKTQCLRSAEIAARPEHIERFAARFATLQRLRHRADYDPAAVFEYAAARQTVQMAAESIRLFEGASRTEQTAFAAWVLLAARRS